MSKRCAMGKSLKSKRGLDDVFIEDLTKGKLKPILDIVNNDNSLIMEIRDNYINIYYRGGSILKLNKSGNNYHTFFDNKYSINNNYNHKVSEICNVKQISSLKETYHWVEGFPLLKQSMDIFHTITVEKMEREFQQLVVRENNISKSASDTDYYIIDFEYTNSSNRNAKFDLIGLKWESTATERKNPSNCNIALIEMKYGDSALSGNSGILKHIKDVDNFLNKSEEYINFKSEMLKIFKQKRELGLIRFSNKGNNNDVTDFSDKIKPEFILLLAGHKPVKSKLKEILAQIKPMKNAELKFATASFMGYALYSKNIIGLDEFEKYF